MQGEDRRHDILDPRAMTTPRRYRRLREVLRRRQPDLTVLMEVVHKPHNLSAVIRSCDAVGVHRVHAIPEKGSASPFHGISGGVKRYVEVRDWDSVEAATEHLHARDHQILAAHPAPEATEYHQVDYTRPTAILLGQEKDGLTETALAVADRRISIPMEGMGASLNVSVAAALVLFEAQRQRRAAGLYDTCRLDPETFETTLFEWAFPKIARLCRERGMPYPEVAEDGTILGEVPR